MNPANDISGPARLSERRSHAIAPHDEQHATDREVDKRHAELPPVERRPLGRQPEADPEWQSGEPGPSHGQSTTAESASTVRSLFGMKLQAGFERELPAVRRDVAARRENDPRPADRDRRRHGEPVDVGQLHVEQDEVRLQAADRVDGGASVGSLADDVEAAGLEESTRRRAEPRVVVHDEHASSPRSHCGRRSA